MSFLPGMHPGGFMASPGIGGNDAFTMLLLQFAGVDAATVFSDGSVGGAGSPHTVTANGNAQIDTAQFKFGVSSGLFDGTGDYLSIPANADWSWGTNPFTVDFWVMFNASTRQYIWDLGSNATSIIITPSSGLVEIYGPGSHVINAGASAFSTGVWYHIELVRSGSSWIVFRDGVSYVTATDARSFGNGTDVLKIGAGPGLVLPLNGWLDEFRVSKGIARHTVGFTPPTVPYS